MLWKKITHMCYWYIDGRQNNNENFNRFKSIEWTNSWKLKVISSGALEEGDSVERCVGWPVARFFFCFDAFSSSSIIFSQVTKISSLGSFSSWGSLPWLFLMLSMAPASTNCWAVLRWSTTWRGVSLFPVWVFWEINFSKYFIISYLSRSSWRLVVAMLAASWRKYWCVSDTANLISGTFPAIIFSALWFECVIAKYNGLKYLEIRYSGDLRKLHRCSKQLYVLTTFLLPERMLLRS